MRKRNQITFDSRLTTNGPRSSISFFKKLASLYRVENYLPLVKIDKAYVWYRLKHRLKANNKKIGKI